MRNFMLFALVAIMAACSSRMSNEEVLQEYLNRHNAHDIDATLELFHEDARIILPDQPPMNEIRKMEAWDAAISSNLYYENWEVDEDTIFVGRIVEKNNWFRRAGISQIEYQPGTRFVFRDGKILEIRTAGMTEESQAALEEMFRAFMQWAFENRPNRVRKLMPNNEFSFSVDNAEEWFLLLDEWQRTR